MPLSAAVLVVVSLCTSRGEDARTRDLFERMSFRRAGWTPRSIAGAAVAAVGLVAMIAFGFLDHRLPDSFRPWNVVGYLVVLTLFAAGMIFASDALLPVPEEETGEAAPIEHSWMARRLATGRTWAIVYGTAAVLVVVIYLLA